MKKTFIALILVTLFAFSIFSTAFMEEKAPLTLSILFEKWLNSKVDGGPVLPEDLLAKALPVDSLLRIAFTHVMDQYPEMTLEDFHKILRPDISLETEEGKTIFRFSSFLINGHFHYVLDATTGELLFADVSDGADING